jgi:two-component system phosphate regulon sensor histidine kinase PhoR
MAAMPAAWAERAREGARTLVVREAPEPRITQTVFLLLVIIDVALRALGDDNTGTTDLFDAAIWPSVGLSLILVAQVVAAFTPWQRIPTALIGALPVLDIAGLGFLRLNPEAHGAGILVVIPAIWLVWQFGLRGLAILVGASVAFLAAAPLVYFGIDTAALSRSVLDPLVAVLIGGAVWALLTNTWEREAQLASRSGALAKAVHELGEARAFATAIFDSVDVGLVLLGSDGEYLALNDRHQEFLDLAFPDGHAGEAGQMGEVYAADGLRRLAGHEMPPWRAARGEEFDDIRIWVGSDPVTRRALSVSARSVHDQDGSLVGAALATKDVTDFMRAMAVKDEFVAMVSHEFRTPLTSINGYVSLLLDEPEHLTEDDIRCLQIVSRNTDRLARLVTDLLASARFDGRNLEIDPEPTEVTEVVRLAVDAALPGAEAKQLSIDLEAPRHLTATVDPVRFAQVVDNLLSNAVKYTPGGGRVSLRLTADQNSFTLCVADTGIGISPEDLDRLFTRFFRAEAVETSSIQGIGLGLSITKKIVDAHGGRIDVESSQDGSSFTVWMPLAHSGTTGSTAPERDADQSRAGAPAR